MISDQCLFLQPMLLGASILNQFFEIRTWITNIYIQCPAANLFYAHISKRFWSQEYFFLYYVEKCEHIQSFVSLQSSVQKNNYVFYGNFALKKGCKLLQINFSHQNFTVQIMQQFHFMTVLKNNAAKSMNLFEFQSKNISSFKIPRLGILF